MSAIAMIDEASKVPIKFPILGLLPFLSFLVVIPFVVWTVYFAVYIQSSNDVVIVPMPSYIAIPGYSIGGGGSQSSSSKATASSLELPNWRIPAHLFNIFMFLWVFGILNAVCFMMIALCAVFWYFSGQGDRKEPPHNSVEIAARVVVRHHLGTVVFGSFLVTIVQLMRVMQVMAALLDLEVDVTGLKKYKAMKYVVACVRCLQEYLDWIVLFISKNAYIMTAIEGYNFLESAERAAQLLLGNARAPSATITIICECFMIFGKLSITGLTTLIALGIAQDKTSQSDDDGNSSGLRSGVLVVFCCSVVAYITSALFVNLLSVCMDAMLMCYYVENEGSSAPRYIFSALRKIMDNEQLKKKLLPAIRLVKPHFYPLIQTPWCRLGGPPHRQDVAFRLCEWRKVR